MAGRTLVISDVHGMLDELRRVLKRVGYESGDRLVFLGDYINRGAQSREVIEFLIGLKENRANRFLRGNHEEIILKLLDGNPEYWYMWLEYGEGRACLRSYGVDPDRFESVGTEYTFRNGGRRIPLGREETGGMIREIFPAGHLAFMAETRPVLDTETVFFSHAGIETGIPLEDQTLYTDYFLLWGDEDFLQDDRDYGRRVVYGHYHLSRPLIAPNKICIALKDAVAVFDPAEGRILDSRGLVTNVVKFTC